MSLPSVLLHDHLDGGLRPATVLQLAEEIGYEDLPADREADLAAWFDQSGSGSLERYLHAFDHTIAVMQTVEALERVAFEASLDLASDGVVYAELRFSPPLHTSKGLSQAAVIQAVASGLEKGEAETGMAWGLIIDALRHREDSVDLAHLAATHRHLGVVGFDLAGPEAGNPPERHLAACRLARESGLRLTIHAGEAAGRDGVAYIASSMDRCGGERIGHGVQLVEDCVIGGGEIVSVGPVAARVRDRGIPLEMCPASNLATGNLLPEDHPVGALYRAGFNVTLNTDNRLMSATAMTAEFDFARNFHRFTVADLALVTRSALRAAFCGWENKRVIWETKISPVYIEAGVDPGLLKW